MAIVSKARSSRWTVRRAIHGGILASVIVSCGPATRGPAIIATPEEDWLAWQYPADIPEWDDEQGFLAGDVFRLPARIAANPYAYLSFSNPAVIKRVRNGVLIAIADVDDPDAGSPGNPYTRLRLSPGRNCIWLERVTEGGGDKWKSYVTPAGAAPERKCTSAPSNVATRFDVEETPAPGEALLELARFTEDNGGNTIIGFKCGARWCDVVPGGSGTAARAPGDRPNGPAGSEWKNKSRHDEEVLAILESGQLKKAVPAAIAPDPRAKGLKIASGDYKTFVTVARIALPTDPPTTSKYYTQWGLRGNGINEIQVKLDLSNPSSPTWLAQNVFTHANGTVSAPKELTIVWHRHGRKHHGLGRAQWLWDPRDQRGWIDCDAGCCDITGK